MAIDTLEFFQCEHSWTIAGACSSHGADLWITTVKTTLAFDNNQSGGKTEYVSQIHQVSILSEASQNYQTWRSIRIVQFKAISENSNHLRTTLHMLLLLEPVSRTSAVVLKVSSLAPALVWRRLRTSMQQLPHPAARRKICRLAEPPSFLRRQICSESVKMGIFVYTLW